jgi:hypothetical protein
MKMFSLNNCERRLGIKDPPIGSNYLYSRFNSFDIMSVRTALYVSPPALDDTTVSSAQTVNCHIREPQTSFNYIISPHIL